MRLTMKLIGCVLLSSMAISTHVQAHVKCGTEAPDPITAGIEETRLRRFKENHSGGRKLQYQTCDELCKRCIEIPVAFHLTGVADANGTPRIAHPTYVMMEYFDGSPLNIPDSLWTTYDQLKESIDQQMDILNESFANTPFYFTLLSADPEILVNSDWTRYPKNFGPDMYQAVGVSDLTVLNVFLAYNAGSMDEIGSNTVTIAFATFPGYQYEDMGDGIYMRYDALPGGGYSGTDSGYTLTHEAGAFMVAAFVCL